MIWAYMLQPNRSGFFNTVAWYLGLSDGQVPFLSDPAWQLQAMILINVWKTTPFMALLLLAGLQLIPETSTRLRMWMEPMRFSSSSA